VASKTVAKGSCGRVTNHIFQKLKNIAIDTVTFCHRFDTTDTNIFKSSPNKCHFLDPRHNFQNIYRASSSSMNIGVLLFGMGIWICLKTPGATKAVGVEIGDPTGPEHV
jgi:hypothetical protein